MKKVLAIICISAILCGCKGEGTQMPVNNSKGNYEVQLLFEVDGTKVYRFYDGGVAVYFTNCNGEARYSYSQFVGKTYMKRDVQTLCNSDTKH